MNPLTGKGANRLSLPSIQAHVHKPLYCSSLSGITIGGSVTSIGNNAFFGCSSLGSVNIPASVTSLGDNIFSECGNLTEIGVESLNPSYTSVIHLAVRKDATHSNDFIVGKLAGTELPPAGKTTFTVTFRPRAPGNHTTVIHIESNDADENPFDIVLTGTQSRQPEISVQQPVGNQLRDGVSSISFGRVMVRSVSGRTFTIRNTGSAVLEGITVTLNGKNPKDFTVASPPKSSLAPGAGTTFRVTFKPSAAGARIALIHIRSNDRGQRHRGGRQG